MAVFHVQLEPKQRERETLYDVFCETSLFLFLWYENNYFMDVPIIVMSCLWYGRSVPWICRGWCIDVASVWRMDILWHWEACRRLARFIPSSPSSSSILTGERRDGVPAWTILCVCRTFDRLDVLLWNCISFFFLFWSPARGCSECPNGREWPVLGR